MELPVAESFTGMAKLKEPYPLTMVGKRGRTRAKTRIVVLILGFLPDFLDKGRMVFFYIIPLSSRTKTAGTSYMKRAAYGLTNFGVGQKNLRVEKTLEKSSVVSPILKNIFFFNLSPVQGESLFGDKHVDSFRSF